MDKASLLTFGPVPSRRLGRSLGINNIPPKVCTYACVYCQVGKTTRLHDHRRSYYEPAEIVRAVERRLERAKSLNEEITYLTFVPDGEPTLDINLGEAIDLLKQFGIPVAVITNGSLIWRGDVRNDLAKADWVSVKADCFETETWRAINRPHRVLKLSSIRDGLFAFAEAYQGTLVTETMLVRGINDNERCMNELADVLRELKPQVAYLSVPTRPPAEEWATAPDEATVNRAYLTLAAKVPRVDLLIDYEGDTFVSTAEVEADLLAIAAVHPLRDEAVTAMLSKAGSGRDTLDRLVHRGSLVRTEYGGHTYYLRNFGGSRKGSS